MDFFNVTVTDTDLYPAHDPEIITLQAALDQALREAAPAAQAWADYCEAHRDDMNAVPFSRQKQRVYDRFGDTAEAVDDAQAALTPVLAAATERAVVVWDEKIRQAFLDDLPAIEAFIALLAQHEATGTEAQLAGCPHALKVPVVFLTAEEVRSKLAYAKGQLGLT